MLSRCLVRRQSFRAYWRQLYRGTRPKPNGQLLAAMQQHKEAEDSRVYLQAAQARAHEIEKTRRQALKACKEAKHAAAELDCNHCLSTRGPRPRPARHRRHQRPRARGRHRQGPAVAGPRQHQHHPALRPPAHAGGGFAHVQGPLLSHPATERLAPDAGAQHARGLALRQIGDWKYCPQAHGQFSAVSRRACVRRLTERCERLVLA